MRIFFVEDDERIRMGVKRLAAVCGHEVTAVATLAEARERYVPGEYDLVLVDEWLADGERGMELLPWFSAQWPELRFVLTSGTRPPPDFPYAPPARDYLRKPFGRADLEGMLARTPAAA